VENLQVLGWAEGLVDEEKAFHTFLKANRWVYDTDFKEIICIEIKYFIQQGKRFFIKGALKK